MFCPASSLPEGALPLAIETVNGSVNPSRRLCAAMMRAAHGGSYDSHVRRITFAEGARSEVART